VIPNPMTHKPEGINSTPRMVGGTGPVGASGNFGLTTLILVPDKGILLILPSPVLHTWTITLRNGTVLSLNVSTSPFVTQPFALDSATFESIQIDEADTASQFIELPDGSVVPFTGTPSLGGSSVINSEVGIGTVLEWVQLAQVPPGTRWVIERIGVEITNGSGNAVEVGVGAAAALSNEDGVALMDYTTAAARGTYYCSAGVGIASIVNGDIFNFQQWSHPQTMGAGDVLEVYLKGTGGEDLVAVWWSGRQYPA
jgi:hypothetical protein